MNIYKWTNRKRKAKGKARSGEGERTFSKLSPDKEAEQYEMINKHDDEKYKK